MTPKVFGAVRKSIDLELTAAILRTVVGMGDGEPLHLSERRS